MLSEEMIILDEISRLCKQRVDIEKFAKQRIKVLVDPSDGSFHNPSIEPQGALAPYSCICGVENAVVSSFRLDAILTRSHFWRECLPHAKIADPRLSSLTTFADFRGLFEDLHEIESFGSALKGGVTYSGSSLETFEEKMGAVRTVVRLALNTDTLKYFAAEGYRFINSLGFPQFVTAAVTSSEMLLEDLMKNNLQEVEDHLSLSPPEDQGLGAFGRLLSKEDWFTDQIFTSVPASGNLGFFENRYFKHSRAKRILTNEEFEVCVDAYLMDALLLRKNAFMSKHPDSAFVSRLVAMISPAIELKLQQLDFPIDNIYCPNVSIPGVGAANMLLSFINMYKDSASYSEPVLFATEDEQADAVKRVFEPAMASYSALG